jgi:hypothetical protein
MNQLAYDYVLIDCPPSLGFLTFNALRAADQVIVPIDMSAFSLMGVGKLLGMLELIKIKIFHAPRVNALATLYDNRTKYSKTMYDEIHAFFKNQMLSTTIRMNVDLKKAAAKGVCVTKFNKESIGAQDYVSLAKELLKIDEAVEFEKALSSSSQENKANLDRERDVPPINMPRPVSAIDERRQPQVPTRDALFNVDAPTANDIYVVGNFNDWKPTEEYRLSRLGDGKWEKKLTLTPGRYKYKFLIDGQWVMDSQNNEREQNSFGTFDSVINL